MEFFPDGHHVRLQSRDRAGMYLHADEDGVGVYLSRERASLNAAWQVHRVAREDGATYVLLHGAAYGRYLKATDVRAPFGYRGDLVVQGVYDDARDDSVAWVPVKHRNAENQDQVLLQHKSGGSLRANGKYFRWLTGVSVDGFFKRDTMMLWVVESIPPRPQTPELLPPGPAPPRALWDKLLCRTERAEERRTIRFLQARNDGSVEPNVVRREIEFSGRSVYNLRLEVARLTGGGVLDYKLCCRAGNSGRLISLVADLPRNEEPVDVVLLPNWTRTIELQDPNVDV